MRLHARQGRTTAALRYFQDFSNLLRAEVDAYPEDATIALYDELRGARATAPGLNTLTDYAFVLEQMVHCVVVTDMDSKVVGWNRAAEIQFGFSKSFMCGRKPTLIYAPLRDQSLADGVFKVARERGQWSKRVTLISKDGRECVQQRTVQPLYNRDGDLIGAFGVGVAA